MLIIIAVLVGIFMTTVNSENNALTKITLGAIGIFIVITVVRMLLADRRNN